MRANTLVEPPGIGARAVLVPTTPLAASLRVPSPPRTATMSTPSAAAPLAMRVAWPRRAVSRSSTSWSAESAFWITTRVRAVTEEAEALAIRTIFMRASWAYRRKLPAGKVGRNCRKSNYIYGIDLWLQPMSRALTEGTVATINRTRGMLGQ